MSEQVAATPTSTPDVTPVSQVTTELAPNTVIHAPEPIAAPAPVTSEVPTDYRVNTLENGQREVVLNSGQRYVGDVDTVINELAKAQYNASRHITDLKSQIPVAPVVPQSNEPQIDPTAKALADLVAQGEGFRDSAEKMQYQGRIMDAYEQQHINQLAANFMASTPDFFPSPENGQRVDDTLKAFGLEANPATLSMVHNHLKATGQYVVPPQGQQMQRSPAMPMPPNGQQAQQQGQPSEAELWSMPMADFEKLYRQGRS